MIKVKRLRHVTFTSPNIEAQLDYYQSVIGLGVIERSDGRRAASAPSPTS